VDPSVLAGLTLDLRMNGMGPVQQVVFDGSTAIVDQINGVLVGGRAYVSAGTEAVFLVRSDIREAPGSVEILGGTALVALSLVVGLITEKNTDRLIATIPASEAEGSEVNMDDPDGVLQDWYAISTVSSLGQESLRSNYRQPITTTGPLCALEGVVVNLQGARIPDAEIRATIISPPQTPGTGMPYVAVAPITTLSGPDGRFSLVLLQGAEVMLEIPAVNFSRNIEVPQKSFEFINNIAVDLDYQFPLEYRGSDQ
jgi:hypothetical protein